MSESDLSCRTVLQAAIDADLRDVVVIGDMKSGKIASSLFCVGDLSVAA